MAGYVIFDRMELGGEEARREGGRLTGWRYVASTSESPRSSHQKYAGKIYRKDDPIWHRIFPPWDFNCKCSVEEVAADEVEEDKVEPLTKEDKLPAIAESGFAFDPAEALRVYDPELIHSEDLRENTVRDLLGFGCIQREDGKLEMPIDNAPEDESERYYAWQEKAYAIAPTSEGVLRPKKSGIQIGKTIRKAKAMYGKKETTILRDDGVDKRAIGKNDLKHFRRGPVLDTVVPVIAGEQQVLQDNGFAGFRGIIRLPAGKHVTNKIQEPWNRLPYASSSDGILALNELRLLSLCLDDIPGDKHKAVWCNFNGSARIKCIVLHEFGHQIYSRLAIEHQELLEKIRQLHSEQMANGFGYDSCKINEKEWFAENYCAWRMNPKLMDNSNLISIFTSIIKTEESKNV